MCGFIREYADGFSQLYMLIIYLAPEEGSPNYTDLFIGSCLINKVTLPFAPRSLPIYSSGLIWFDQNSVKILNFPNIQLLFQPYSVEIEPIVFQTPVEIPLCIKHSTTLVKKGLYMQKASLDLFFNYPSCPDA